MIDMHEKDIVLHLDKEDEKLAKYTKQVRLDMDKQKSFVYKSLKQILDLLIDFHSNSEANLFEFYQKIA